MYETIEKIVFWYNIFVLFYFLAINFSYLSLLLFASERLVYFKRRRRTRICTDEQCVLLPSVALIVPAYNEERTIVESVKSFLAVDYPDLEVILVNDGSGDKTLEVLKNSFNLIESPRASSGKIRTQIVKAAYRSRSNPRLVVIDKENGGKADALNAGLNYSRSKLYAGVDSDSLLDKDALTRLVQPYLERDAKVLALGGIVMPANGSKIEEGQVVEPRVSKKFLPAIQTMEYIRAFLGGRTGWSKLNSLLIISGAFGLFERKEVLELGGYRTDTVGEDMDIVLRLHRKMRDDKKKYKMVFIPDPVCWTQVPESLGSLAMQRRRWQRGLVESLTHNWKMFLNPRYGAVGLFAIPFYFIFELLGPAVEFSGYVVVILAWILGIINWQIALVFFILAVIFGVLLSLFSLLLAEFTTKKYTRPLDVVKLFIFAVLENFGYRQLTSWWRFTALFGVRSRRRSWGEIERTDFAQAKPGRAK